MQPNEEEASNPSHNSKFQDAADVVKDIASHGVFTNAGNAFDAGVAATKVVGDAVTGVAQNAAGAARPYVVNQYTEAAAKPFVYVTEPVIQQYNNLLSPIVSGEGDGFGAQNTSGKEEVILRIEISASSEVKAMRTCSYIINVFSFLATFALIGMKFEADANAELKESNDYFLSSVIITSVFLAVLLIVAGVFIRRIVNAWRTGLLWSKRRMYIASSVFLVLILQISNLSAMLASAIYALTKTCRWQSLAVYSLGFVQWTLWNGTLLLLIVFAHNASFWRGKTKSSIEEKEEKKRRASNKKTLNNFITDDKGDNGGTASIGIDVPVEAEIQQQPLTALVMDAPVRIHLPKLLLWGALQATLIIMLLKFTVKGYGDSCLGDGPLICGPSTDAAKIGLIVHICIIWAYFLTYCYFAWQTDKDLRSRPYTEMRLARMVFGIQHEQVLPVFFTFTVSTTLFLAIQTQNCWTFVQTWMGVVPLQAMGTAMAGSLCFYFMPKKPGSAEEILQAWLQEFAWSEKQVPEAIRRRNAKLAGSKTLRKKPMFCIETAIKMLYYSKLVYKVSEEELEEVAGGYGGTGNSGVSTLAGGKSINKQLSGVEGETKDGDQKKQPEKMDNVIADLEVGEIGRDPLLCTVPFAKSFYGLTKAELFFEGVSDTKGIILWGNNTIVVAFKGTSSFENALTDINFLKVYHPPTRTAPMSSFWGFKLIPTPVRVHKGFLDAWTKNGFDQRVLARINQLINEEFSYQDPESNTDSNSGSAVSIYVTGHSLGGALATLAAHAIKSAHPSVNMSVYTFGSPRVGNKSFAYEYNSLINNHFGLISGQDPVARQPKGWYKRVGDRVLLDILGNIIVRPTYLEMHLINRLAPKVADHMIATYRLSLMRSIKMQVSRWKGEEGEEARELARGVDLNKALLGVHLSEKELENPDLVPVTLEQVQKMEQVQKRMEFRKTIPQK